MALYQQFGPYELSPTPAFRDPGLTNCKYAVAAWGDNNVSGDVRRGSPAITTSRGESARLGCPQV
jgi:hypothetical protein